VDPNIHERLELTLSHMHEVETDSAFRVALCQFREYLQGPTGSRWRVRPAYMLFAIGRSDSRSIDVFHVIHVEDYCRCAVAFRGFRRMKFAWPVYFKLMERLEFHKHSVTEKPPYPSEPLFELASVGEVQILTDPNDKLWDQYELSEHDSTARSDAPLPECPPRHPRPDARPLVSTGLNL
jgi:hypothetical protein